MLDWLGGEGRMFWWLAAAGFSLSIIGCIVLPIVIARLPEDYFVSRHRAPLEHLRDRPILRYTLVILKNLAGWFCLVLSAAMFFGPGPGILAFVLAVSLMDFPGKHRMRRRLARNRILHRILDAIRRRAGKPCFRLPNRVVVSPASADPSVDPAS